MNLVVLAFALGNATTCPEGGRTGTPLNAEQTELKTLVLKRVDSMRRHLRPNDTGAVCEHGVKIPALAESIGGVAAAAACLDFVPYCRMRSRTKNDNDNDNDNNNDNDNHHNDSLAACGARRRHSWQTQATRSRSGLPPPLVAARMSIPSADGFRFFDPTPYLCSSSAASYMDPNLLLLPREDWPPATSKLPVDRHELLLLGKRYDDIGAVFLFPPGEVDDDDEAIPFPTYKDELRDRHLLDRRRRNRKEKPLKCGSQFMPNGCMLADLDVADGEVLLFSVNDLSDMYWAFLATETRARCTPVGPAFPAEAFTGWSAYSRLKEKQKQVSSTLRMGFGGLSQGDAAGVDYAQESHRTGLKSVGCLDPSQELLYRSVMPHFTDYVEGVMLDDHLGCLRVAKRRYQLYMQCSTDTLARDLATFDAAEQWYADVGFRSNLKKRKTRSVVVSAWGSENEGVFHLVGPIRAKLAGFC